MATPAATSAPRFGSVRGARFGSGAAWAISIDTSAIRALARRVASISQTFAIQLDRVMATEARVTVGKIQVRWPVWTGRSRGIGRWQGFGWQVSKTRKLEYVIFNPAVYTGYIQPKGFKRGKGPKQVTLIARPEVRKMRARITDSAKRIIREALARKRALQSRGTVPGRR